MKSVAFLTTCLLLAGTLLLARLRDRQAPEPLARPFSEFPIVVDGWTGTDDPPLQAHVSKSLSATSYLSRTYRRPGAAPVNLFIAYYANPRAGETMHSPRYCLLGGGWVPLYTATAAVQWPDGRAEVNRWTLFNSGQRVTVLYWYQNPQRVVASEYWSKLWMVWDTLSRRQLGAAIVRLTAPDDPQSAHNSLALATKIIPEVARSFGPALP